MELGSFGEELNPRDHPSAGKPHRATTQSAFWREGSPKGRTQSAQQLWNHPAALGTSSCPPAAAAAFPRGQEPPEPHTPAGVALLPSLSLPRQKGVFPLGLVILQQPPSSIVTCTCCTPRQIPRRGKHHLTLSKASPLLLFFIIFIFIFPLIRKSHQLGLHQTHCL